MSANPDLYYDRPECSNSNLSELDKLLRPGQYEFDYSEALRFGILVDAMITEMHRVNVYKRTVDSTIYLQSDFDTAREMKAAFYRDPICAAFAKISEFQKVSAGKVEFEWGGFKFSLDCRAKWDGWMPLLKHGYDIKTTTATTQRQFEEACEYFHYFRSRAFYMALENSKSDMLIGISKINKKIFKIPIVKGDKNWQKGYDQACDLSFSFWQLFDGFNEIVTI